MCLGETAFLLPSPLFSVVIASARVPKLQILSKRKKFLAIVVTFELESGELEWRREEIVLFLKKSGAKDDLLFSASSGPHQISAGRKRRLRAVEGIFRHGTARWRGLHGI